MGGGLEETEAGGVGRYSRLCPEGLAIQGGSRPSLALTCVSICSPLKSVLSAGHEVWDRGYSEKTGFMCVA